MMSLCLAPLLLFYCLFVLNKVELCTIVLLTLSAYGGERLCNGTVSVCPSSRSTAAATRYWTAAAWAPAQTLIHICPQRQNTAASGQRHML